MFYINEFGYTMEEKDFVLYFRRCLEVGIKYLEIERKILPQIQKYYDEMVEDKRYSFRTLTDLFNDWRRFEQGKIIR